jgi:hypothetical protein
MFSVRWEVTVIILCLQENGAVGQSGQPAQ